MIGRSCQTPPRVRCDTLGCRAALTDPCDHVTCRAHSHCSYEIDGALVWCVEECQVCYKLWQQFITPGISSYLLLILLIDFGFLFNNQVYYLTLLIQNLQSTY